MAKVSPHQKWHTVQPVFDDIAHQPLDPFEKVHLDTVRYKTQ
jgi:hypothetical protein